jgi:hypothetical protein
MIRKSMLIVSLVSVASTFACGSASARPVDARHEVAGGWEKLGAREVDGKVDRDVIAVGREDGRFRAIQIQVDGSALEMFEIKVTFGDGQTFEPKTRLVFDKSSRSRTIDLPGDKRVIRKVEFRYGNLPGGGRAKVELWGQSA